MLCCLLWVSRCQVIPFYRLSQEQMTQVLHKEHEQIINNPTIIAIAQGSPGDAIAAFEQLQAIPQVLLQKLVQPPRSPLDALETRQGGGWIWKRPRNSG